MQCYFLFVFCFHTKHIYAKAFKAGFHQVLSVLIAIVFWNFSHKTLPCVIVNISKKSYFLYILFQVWNYVENDEMRKFGEVAILLCKTF